VEGKYLPGDWLRQEEISTQTGVSQTPVREALDLLVSVGLAERVPYRGVRVPELTTDEIIDAYILRLILESTAAHLAALNISGEQLPFRNRRAHRPWSAWRCREGASSTAFHLGWWRPAATPLGKLYEMVSSSPLAPRAYVSHPGAVETSLKCEYDEHLNIVEALTRETRGVRPAKP
jgi:DNA-binding GntR family transcriptional regulator